METLPVIQNFFGKPVRFFKADIVGTWGGYDTPLRLETWMIPFPDFCSALGQEEKEVRRKIRLDDEVYKGLYSTELILDRTNSQRRHTLLMAYEMCQLIVAKLETSRIKDPVKQAMVIAFQQRLMIAFHLLRTGKIRPVRWDIGKDIPAEYLDILSLPMGREHRKTVQELAEREGKSLQHTYRRLQSLRGGNAITKKGTPKRRRSDAGAYRKTSAYKTVEFVYCQHPKLLKKEIARIAGVPYGKVVRWLRAA